MADENVDRAVVERLRAEGHNVWYAAESGKGAKDDEVLELAARGSSILLTADKDFGELVFRQGRSSGGVVLLRLPGWRAEDKARRLSRVLRELGAQLEGAYTVVGRDAVRVRRPSGGAGS